MINYPLSAQFVATGSSYSAVASDDHAKQAVESALRKMSDQSTVGAVLLFLTSAYAHSPKGAIKAAAKAAGTPQIFGCCAVGLLTEEEWLIDVEGAVAMVFPSHLALRPLSVLKRLEDEVRLVLTFSSPNAAEIAINSTQTHQVGAVSSDEYGHGPFSVWQSGRIEEHEFCLTAFPSSLQTHICVADGVKRLSSDMQINLTDSHTLKQVDEKSALMSLADVYRDTAKENPYQLLCAISESNHERNLDSGSYTLHHVVSVDDDSGEIQVSGYPIAGRHMFWCVRDADSARQTLLKKLSTIKQSLTVPPLFAMMFPNMGRGPQFYDGQDRDLELFKQIFPNVPVIGFYGQAEIVPSTRQAGLIKHYSTVIVIYTESE